MEESKFSPDGVMDKSAWVGALSLSLSLSLPVHEKGFFLVLSLPGQQLHVSILFILCQQEGFCTRDQTLLCSVPVGLWYKALAR